MLNVVNQLTEEEVFGDLHGQVRHISQSPMINDNEGGEQSDRNISQVCQEDIKLIASKAGQASTKDLNELKEELGAEVSKKMTIQKDQHCSKEKKKLSSENAPVYGGMRLVQLESNFDSTMRNSMEVIRSEEYKTICIQKDMNFNLRHAMGSGEEKTIQNLLAEYLDVFAWSHLDLTGVNPALGEHRIGLMIGAAPVR